jgi:alkylation response protein AidB-like acyl-CoA dehydrogenase
MVFGIDRLRIQFWRPNSHYVQRIPGALDLVADMATDCEAALLLTIESAGKHDTGEPATKNVVMAKHFATEAAVRAARTAISLHGGVGYMGEYPVEAYLRDAIGLSLYEGTTQIQKLILGRELLEVSAF